MTEIFGYPLQVLLGQLLLGLINGSFYAILSLGLAIIFGLLGIINFSQGALYMVGGFVAWICLNYLGLSYWWTLLLAPVAVAAFGMLLEKLLVSRAYSLDPLYGMLLTLGIALVIEGSFRNLFGSSGLPYPVPPELAGAQRIGSLVVPKYRLWVVFASLSVCLTVWYLIEKTNLGSYLRAATEKPDLTEVFGINVPLLVTVTFGAGIALAAFAGVLAAPVYSVSPGMGAELIIVVFAVVVIGGMGSIKGAILTGYGLGALEGLTKVIYPEGSAMVVFVAMAVTLLFRPAGLFGQKDSK
jgi:branched-chain amino acid transport system permease protein